MDLSTGHQVALIVSAGVIFGAGRPIFRLPGIWPWPALMAIVIIVTAIVTYAWPLLAHI